MKVKLLEQSKTEEENKQKIQILENLINQKTNNQRRLEDERNQYEKMIMEQQKIIRLTLARIVPNKNIQTNTQFCQVHPN